MALNPDVIIIPLLRGVSSAGRALRWQRRGHGFEPRMLHQNIPPDDEGVARRDFR